jgi:peroxiredoxin
MSLTRDLHQLRASLEAQLSRGVFAVVESSMRDSCAMGGEGRPLDVGDRIPNFELELPDGKLRSAGELLANGPLLLCFIRGAWCPFSATELQYIERYAPQVEELGASILALSPEPHARSAALAGALQLRFPVLQDVGNQVARSLGLEIEFDDPLRAVLRADTELLAAGGRRELAVPGLFVIDARGVVRYAFSSPEYHLRAEPEVWLEVLRKI